MTATATMSSSNVNPRWRRAHDNRSCLDRRFFMAGILDSHLARLPAQLNNGAELATGG
jgi:hypothetical protein